MIKDLLSRFVIGKDVPGINALTGEMYDQSFWLKNPGGIAGAALSAIEMALWDIRGKALGYRSMTCSAGGCGTTFPVMPMAGISARPRMRRSCGWPRRPWPTVSTG